MGWILFGGAVICAWAMLRTMGAERERRVLEQRAAAAPPAPPPAPPATKTAMKPPRRQAA
jgi:hypothetical protein